MKRIRVMICLLTASLIAAAFAGCGEAEVTNVDASPKQEQGQQAPHNERDTMAKVISLDGDQLTLIMADLPRGDRDGGGTPPDGKELPAGGNGPAAASGAAIEGPDAPAGGPGLPEQGRPGQGRGDIEFTGEEASYTLSGKVTLKKGFGDAAAEIDLSELAAGDVIRFTVITDESGKEVIDSIVVME
ncbi:MAG: hypothetical protein PHC91_08975 [Eubacteriales bacterium]|nr:hypothetical protein [Eubacteriales bacterium]